MVIVGIDPAFRKNGYALCINDISNNTVDFIIMNDFIQFVSYIDNIPKDSLFCVENSNLQNLSFDMTGNKNVIARKSRNVGMNQAISQLTCDLIISKGYKLLQISPKSKGNKWNNDITSILFKYHKEVKNYKGLESEQDKRDAYKLTIIGKQKNNF